MRLRTATQDDLQYVYATLLNGVNTVLVRSLFRPDQEPYPLLDICVGPFSFDEEGVHAVSLSGINQTLRITESNLHNVELRDEGKDWYGPEMNSVILLVPKTLE